MLTPDSIIQSLSEAISLKSAKILPWVTAKYAMTLDGKMATHNGNSQWITSKTSRNFSRRLRAIHDGVMIGERTALLDNPSLTINKNANHSHRPKRIVFNLNNAIPKHFQVWDNKATSVFILAPSATKKEKETILNSEHAFLICPFLKNEINYREILKELKKKHDIRSIFVEGGAHLLGNFYRHRLINKIIAFIAPKILGDGLNALSPFSISNISPLSTMTLTSELKKTEISSIGKDILISGYLK